MTRDNLPSSLPEFAAFVSWCATDRIEVTPRVYLHIFSLLDHGTPLGKTLVINGKEVYCTYTSLTLEERVTMLENTLRNMK